MHPRTPLVVGGAEAAPGLVPPPLLRGARGRQALHPGTTLRRACAPWCGRTPTRVELALRVARPRLPESVSVRWSSARRSYDKTRTWRLEGALLPQRRSGRLRASLKTRARGTKRAGGRGPAVRAGGRGADLRSWPTRATAKPRARTAAAQTSSACSTTLSEIGWTLTSRTSATTKPATGTASPRLRRSRPNSSLALITRRN